MNQLKSLTGLIVALLFLFSNCDTPTSQSEFTVGHVEWQLIDFKLEEGFPGAEMGGDMLENSTISMFFNDYKELMIMDMMGGFSVTKVLFDRENDQVTSYLHSMGEKMMLKVESPEDNQAHFNIEVDESDRRDILGFDSYKVKMSIEMEGRAPQKMEAYITEKIKPRSSFIQPAHKNPLKGIPLQLTVGDQNMQMTFEAVAFNEEFDESVFDIDESEYQEMNMEEIKQMGLKDQMGF